MAGGHLLPCPGQPTVTAAGVHNVRSAYLGAEVPRNRFLSDGASASGRQHSPEDVWQPALRRCSIQCSVAAPGREHKAIQLEQTRRDESNLTSASSTALICDPESLSLHSGELSFVVREASQEPEDVFRCSGCVLQECQVQHAIHNMGCFQADAALSAVAAPSEAAAIMYASVDAGPIWMRTNALEKLP